MMAAVTALFGRLLGPFWPYVAGAVLAVLAIGGVTVWLLSARLDAARSDLAAARVELDQLQAVNASNAAELARIQQDMAAAAAAVALQQREAKELRRVLTIAEDALRAAPEAERNAPISPLRLDALRRVREYQAGRAD